MFIPLSTDAPLHHQPWATCGLILVNLAVHLLVMNGEISPDAVDWMLTIGDGLHPLQWLTFNFLHLGWLHLLGNMLFLWIFGLVVEGKLGWWRFLLLYLAIGIVQGACEQLVMLGAKPSVALGASGAISGLIAVAMVWAPENQVAVFFLGNFRLYDWPIVAFAALYLAQQVVNAVLGQLQMSSAVLHLFGAAVGLPLGILLVRRGWVDCEGWDWFARRRRNAIPLNLRPSQQALPAIAAPVVEDRSAVRSELATSIRELLSVNQFPLAWQTYSTETAAHGGWLLPQPVHEALIGGLLKARRNAEAKPLLAQAIAAWPATAGLRLAWAQLMLAERKPAMALESLVGLAEAALSPGQAALLARIREQAATLQAQGVIEIDD